MKKKLMTLFTILLVTSCFIACSQSPIEVDVATTTQSTKPFVEVELTPNVSNYTPTEDGVIMIYQ